MPELYPGQTQVVAAKLQEARRISQAREEELAATADHAQRARLLHLLAADASSIGAYERQLAKCEDAEGSSRSEHVRIRVSDAEKAELQRQADAAGESISAYVRRTLHLS